MLFPPSYLSVFPAIFYDHRISGVGEHAQPKCQSCLYVLSSSNKEYIYVKGMATQGLGNNYWEVVVVSEQLLCVDDCDVKKHQ